MTIEVKICGLKTAATMQVALDAGAAYLFVRGADDETRPRQGDAAAGEARVHARLGRRGGGFHFSRGQGHALRCDRRDLQAGGETQ